MKIVVEENGYMPTRSHPTDAGLDLYATETKWVHSHSQATFDIKVRVAIPDGYFGLITSRSGLMGKGITCRGCIDNNYRGTLKAVLYNDSDDGYLVHEGDKITQLVIIPCLFAEVEAVSSLDDTDRGSNGFGSTGVR